MAPGLSSVSGVTPNMTGRRASIVRIGPLVDRTATLTPPTGWRSRRCRTTKERLVTAIDLLRATKETDLRRRLRNAKERERRAQAEIHEIEDELGWMHEQEMLDM